MALLITIVHLLLFTVDTDVEVRSNVLTIKKLNYHPKRITSFSLLGFIIVKLIL